MISRLEHHGTFIKTLKFSKMSVVSLWRTLSDWYHPFSLMVSSVIMVCWHWKSLMLWARGVIRVFCKSVHRLLVLQSFKSTIGTRRRWKVRWLIRSECRYIIRI